MSPRLLDALDMLVGPQHFTVGHVASVLKVEVEALYTALAPLEQHGLVEATKRGTIRESWNSNVGDGTVAELVARAAELPGSPLEVELPYARSTPL